MTHPNAAGVIHDIGYQRYRGPRLGRWYAAVSLYQHSMRTAFGLGRTAKVKIFPWMVVGLCFAVAVVAVVVRSQTGEPYITYLRYPDVVGVPVLLFLAVVTPELLSADLRAHVLPLYFSRPLGRDDYALAKLAAVATACWLLLAGPQLLMYVGGLFSQPDGVSGAWHETTDFLGGLGYAAIAAVLFSSLAVLVSSLASRRAVAAAATVAVFLLTSPVAAILVAMDGSGPDGALARIAPVISPVTLIEGLKTWLYGVHTVNIGPFGPVYLVCALVLAAGCTTLLLARYRKVAA